MNFSEATSPNGLRTAALALAILLAAAEVLSGADQGSQYTRIPAADRAAALEILTTTQPAFAAIRQAAVAASPPAG